MKGSSRRGRGEPRGIGFMAAAVFMALVVFAGGSVLWSVLTRSDPPADPETLTIAPPTAGADAGDACRPTDARLTIPTAPPEVTWQLFGGIALPYSRTAGPLVLQDGGIARCYAHTPLGALIAITQLNVRYMRAPNWRAVTMAQVIPGAGRTAYLRWRPDLTAAATRGFAQTAGFRFITYTPQVAVVEKVAQDSGGGLRAYTFTVHWVDGDWKLQLEADGIPNPPGQNIPALEGFTPWSGI